MIESAQQKSGTLQGLAKAEGKEGIGMSKNGRALGRVITAMSLLSTKRAGELCGGREAR
jgi:hypothetical protein